MTGGERATVLFVWFAAAVVLSIWMFPEFWEWFVTANF